MRDTKLWARLNPQPRLVGSTDALDRSVAILLDQAEAKENWERSYAEKVIAEYWRFLYLSRVSPTQATPSEIIDTVWHLHMQDSATYLAFCEAVFGELHHHEPCEGDETMPRYEAQYEATLALYRQEFGAEPPPEVWQYLSDTQIKTLKSKARAAKICGVLGGLAIAMVMYRFVPIHLGHDLPNLARVMIAAFLGFFGGSMIGSLLQPRQPGPKYKSSSNSGSGCGGGCGGCG